jgi:thymidylate synthase
VNFNTATEAYLEILQTVLHQGNPVHPANPCGATLELTNFKWELSNPEKCYVDFSQTGMPERQEIYQRYVQDELAWYESGNLQASSAPAKFWMKLAGPDGNITSNYGHIIFYDKKYPGEMTAREHAVKLLLKDPESRQVVLHYSEPRHYWDGNKDVPCTVASQILLRDGKINLTTTQRSCDIRRGWSFDVPWNCHLLQMIQADLKGHGLEVKLGTFTHFCGSLHLYKTDETLARKILKL